MESFFAVAAPAGGVLLSLAPTLQMATVVKRRSSEGIALSYWLILTAVMGLWLGYGISSAQPALIIPNACAVTVNLFVLATLVRYRPRAEPSVHTSGGTTGSD